MEGTLMAYGEPVTESTETASNIAYENTGEHKSIQEQLDEINDKLSYSFEEKMVGYIDDKPLYRKRFKGVPNAFTTKDKRANSSTTLAENIYAVYKSEGYVKHGSSTSDYAKFNLGSTAMSTDGAVQRSSYIFVASDNTCRLIIAGILSYQYAPEYDVTIEYTKTTD